ncbi:MAG TPA: putative oxygenase MesX [Gemmatimonadales bacterium]|nr:putative oxygenase MesX [Gemmatimonadales bacterium]
MRARFFIHYTPFDESFDPHELAAEYGTGLLDQDGNPIATTPQAPGYVLDPCVARYTTNPLNLATIGVQTLMPVEQRGDLALQATYRTALMGRLLTRMNEEFQRFLPPDKRDPELALKLDYMTVFLTRERANDTRTAFPAADFLRLRVVDRRTGAELANSFGANASYIFRDTDFFLILPTLKKSPDGTIDTAEFGDCGKLNALLYRAMFKATSPIGVLDRHPVSCIAVSDKYPLHRSGPEHPVIGAPYASDQEAARRRSPTDRYFQLMGVQGSNYLPAGESAPYRFMHHGDLLQRSDYELASVVGVMSVFQKIYQYEMYCADEMPGSVYQADRSKPFTPLAGFPLYDRVARSESLGAWQAELGVKWAEANADLLTVIGTMLTP